jgi:hypothetical protein
VVLVGIGRGRLLRGGKDGQREDEGKQVEPIEEEIQLRVLGEVRLLKR